MNDSCPPEAGAHGCTGGSGSLAAVSEGAPTDTASPVSGGGRGGEH